MKYKSERLGKHCADPWTNQWWDQVPRRINTTCSAIKKKKSSFSLQYM
jgi:hypothetical protein